jgi:hypothetical protein
MKPFDTCIRGIFDSLSFFNAENEGCHASHTFAKEEAMILMKHAEKSDADE